MKMEALELKQIGELGFAKVRHYHVLEPIGGIVVWFWNVVVKQGARS